MKKVLGIAALLLAICLVATWQSWDQTQEVYTFLKPFNLENLTQRVGMFGILSVAAAFVIVTGGIDLSIGAVVCVAGCMLPWLVSRGCPWPLALAAVLLLGTAIGLWHGFLVTVVRLQPFVVTLCGLLLYRGLMRWFIGDRAIGFGDGREGLAWLAEGRLPVTDDFGLPVPAILLVVVSLLAAVFFHRTVAGRHLLALGRNEEAARFSGVATKRLTVLAYAACAGLAALGGAVFVVDVNSAQASVFGNFYELYAIAGAVLGGCALRGGECSVLGLILGAAVMQVLQNAIRLGAESDKLEFAVVGAVILLGAVADEVARRLWRRRRR